MRRKLQNAKGSLTIDDEDNVIAEVPHNDQKVSALKFKILVKNICQVEDKSNYIKYMK